MAVLDVLLAAVVVPWLVFVATQIEPRTLSELTGPVYPYGCLAPTDNDLTTQHAGAPLGERIIVEGRVMDESGRPVPHTLVEIWQANAAGRYPHKADQHPPRRPP